MKPAEPCALGSTFIAFPGATQAVYGEAGLADVRGRVIRVDENPVSSPELWRWRVGVELEAALPADLIEHGARLSSGKIPQAAAS